MNCAREAPLPWRRPRRRPLEQGFGRAEHRRHLACARSCRWILRQHAVHEREQHMIGVRAQRVERCRGVLQVRRAQRNHRIGLEQLPSGEQFVGDTSKAVDVRRRGRRGRAGLLRAHVQWGADVSTCRCQSLVTRCRLRGRADAEVSDDDLPRLALDQQIAGLDVPVHEPFLVRRRERRRDLADGALDVTRGRACPRRVPLGKRRP